MWHFHIRLCRHATKDQNVGTKNIFQEIHLRLSSLHLMTITDRGNTALAHIFKAVLCHKSPWANPLLVGFLLHLRRKPLEIGRYDPRMFLSPIRQVFRVCLRFIHAKSSTMAYSCTAVITSYMYRVIHKSLQDFRTRLCNNQDRHGRKGDINR